MHFQLQTTEGLIIDLDECMKFNEMVKALEKVGCIQKIDSTLTVNLLFLDNLRDGG